MVHCHLKSLICLILSIIIKFDVVFCFVCIDGSNRFAGIPPLKSHYRLDANRFRSTTFLQVDLDHSDITPTNEGIESKCTPLDPEEIIELQAKVREDEWSALSIKIAEVVRGNVLDEASTAFDGLSKLEYNQKVNDISNQVSEFVRYEINLMRHTPEYNQLGRLVTTLEGKVQDMVCDIYANNYYDVKEESDIILHDELISAINDFCGTNLYSKDLSVEMEQRIMNSVQQLQEGRQKMKDILSKIGSNHMLWLDYRLSAEAAKEKHAKDHPIENFMSKAVNGLRSMF
eukprot:scaffold87617_cov61-Attheya_sp.AAC.3